MIPLKLELQNFLAYRDPEPLDLTGLHLACLAGANGAGKSSLLDAMTWCLWGKARARRDDDLIHGQEMEMRVCLTFMLEGNCYRATRYRSRKGRGSSLLELEVQDGNEWRSLSEPTIRDTQERITRLLRLDYQTFINSAFLMQGRADEFTQKTPGERKAILGEIIGLDVWDMYEERAKLHLRAIDQQGRQIEAEIERIDQDLSREGEYQRELVEAQQALDDLTEQVQEAEEYVNALENARRRQDSLRANFDDLQRRVGLDQEELGRLHADRAQVQSQLDSFRMVVAYREEIEQGYAALQDARQQEQEFSTRLMEVSGLRARSNELQQAVNAARAKLEAEQEALTRQCASVRQTIDKGIGAGEVLAAHQNKIAELEALEAECDTWREELSSLREKRAELEATNRNLKTAMESLMLQRDQIEAATEPICPLCQQELSAAHRIDLLERLQQQGEEKADEFRANREQQEELDEKISGLSKTINRAEGELRSLPAEREYVTRLEAQVELAEAARVEMETLEARLAELEATLTREVYAEEAQTALLAVEADLARLGYDEQAHHVARQLITEYESYEVRKNELDHVLKAVPEVETRLARLDGQISALEGRVGEDLVRLDALSQEIEALAEQLIALEQWEVELANRRDAQGRAHVQVGAARQKLSALENQRQRQGQLLSKRDQLAEERGIYEQLRDAFGKDGIPAMIIEATIPEIESEANEILSRMTDGRMHVRFETQREKVTGGVKETLDIKIADELGTRDYETFSGGESFRVDFAIRLALSRLLARRAGAQLRTLIIDEGFGTQDEQGRERLVHAINSIREDFDLILVITHIDELKDAFPARIEVTKTPQGSLAEVV